MRTRHVPGGIQSCTDSGMLAASGSLATTQIGYEHTQRGNEMDILWFLIGAIAIYLLIKADEFNDEL